MKEEDKEQEKINEEEKVKDSITLQDDEEEKNEEEKIESAQNPIKRSGQKPRSGDSMNWLIHILYTRGEYDECLRLIESQLAECNGMSEYPIYIKGLILRERGKIAEALELFQAATLLNPKNTENMKQIGRTLFLSGKHKAAVDVFDEASMQNSGVGDWEIYQNKGLCYKYLGEYPQALESFENANLIQPHDITFIEKAKVFLAMERLDDALNTFLEALNLSPENEELLTTIGLIYLRKNEPSMAFDFLGSSLAVDGSNPKTILAAGSIIQDRQDMDVALSKYRIAAAKTPNCPQLWNNIGMCFFGKEKYIAAIACLRRSLYLDPFQWITAHNLGLLFLHTEQNASAFHYLSCSINLQRNSSSSYMYLAIALFRMQDTENAIAAYEQAIALDDLDPLTWVNYAGMMLSQGNIEKSKELFERFYDCMSSASYDEREKISACSHALIKALVKVHGTPHM